jgi:hypothetical protein
MSEQNTTTMRGDNRKSPEIVKFEILTTDECKALTGHAHILDRVGKVARVKITSVKTWKRRPDVEVRCQYGLYEHFKITITPTQPSTELVKLV